MRGTSDSAQRPWHGGQQQTRRWRRQHQARRVAHLYSCVQVTGDWGAPKFGAARVEDEARGRLLAALALATLEPQDGKICLIIEDSLARNWLQGREKGPEEISI